MILYNESNSKNALINWNTTITYGCYFGIKNKIKEDW